MHTPDNCSGEAPSKSNGLPKYHDLMYYVEKWIGELLNGGKEIEEFKARYKLTESVVECGHTRVGTCYIWIEFRLLPEVGPMPDNPLPREALVWLEKYLGAYLWPDRTVSFREGGGKISYRLSIFPPEGGEDLKLFERLSPWYWSGGHWKKHCWEEKWSVREPDPVGTVVLPQAIEEVREHCRFVGKGIEKMVADGEDLLARFEGKISMVRFKVEKDCSDVKIVGGEMDVKDSHIVVSESGVTETYGDEIVGYAFDPETRAALVEFFDMLYYP